MCILISPPHRRDLWNRPSQLLKTRHVITATLHRFPPWGKHCTGFTHGGILLPAQCPRCLPTAPSRKVRTPRMAHPFYKTWPASPPPISSQELSVSPYTPAVQTYQLFRTWPVHSSLHQRLCILLPFLPETFLPDAERTGFTSSFKFNSKLELFTYLLVVSHQIEQNSAHKTQKYAWDHECMDCLILILMITQSRTYPP